jgi:hypothetical protein
MRELTPELRMCVDIGREPHTQGSVNLTWVIEQDGSAGMMQVAQSTIDDPSVEGCMAGVTRRATFPGLDEPFADVHWTVDLATLGPASAPAPAAGILGPTDVNAVLAANQNTLAGCLAMAQAGGREVTGELELHWRVAADGQVAWARIASATVHDVEVERCLVSTMMTISFPRPTGGAADLSMPLKLL